VHSHFESVDWSVEKLKLKVQALARNSKESDASVIMPHTRKQGVRGGLPFDLVMPILPAEPALSSLGRPRQPATPRTVIQDDSIPVVAQDSLPGHQHKCVVTISCQQQNLRVIR